MTKNLLPLKNNSDNDLQHYRHKLNKSLALYQHSYRQVQLEKQTLKKAKAHVSHVLQAQGIVQEIAEAVQAAVHRQIASVVSQCLESVFAEEAYEFQILFAKKRGKTEARLLFVRDGQAIDPLDAAGGGVIDVAAFALRLACLLLSQPKRRKLLVLDEPFRFVSQEYIPKVRDMLVVLAKEMEVQFVIVSHIHGLQAGKVVELD